MTQPSFNSRLSQFSEDKHRRLANATAEANLIGPEPKAPLPEVPPANKDPLGLEAWAGELGISRATALQLSAVTLAHVAGPSLYFEGSRGLNGMAAPSHLAAESDGLLRAALSRLTAYLVVIQQRLLLGSQEFPRAAVDEEFYKVSPVGNAMSGELEKFKTPAQDFFESRPEHRLHAMLALGDRSIHRENILHPMFLLASLPAGTLEPLLAGCNHGHAFIAGGTEHLPTDKPARLRRLDELIRVIDGQVVQSSPPSVVPAKAVKLGGLFLFRQSDLHWLYDHRRDVLRKLIPVSSNPPPLDEPFDYKPEAAGQFQRRFNQAAAFVLARRRICEPADQGFADEEARRNFIVGRRQHLLISATDPVNLTSLPDLLMWFLLLIAPDNVTEMDLVDLAIRTTETIRHEACRTFVLHDQMELGRTRHENALKMLRRIADKGPQKRHMLVRIFPKQSLEIHHGPVIEKLIANGFLKEDTERLLHLGSRPATKLNLGDLIGNSENQNAR